MFATEAQRGGPAAATAALVRALAEAWNAPCDDNQIAALSRYAESLLRWNARINLTAARTIDVLVAEHFPDAFALARKLEPAGARRSTSAAAAACPRSRWRCSGPASPSTLCRADRQEGGVPPDGDPRARPRRTGSRCMSDAARPSPRRSPRAFDVGDFAGDAGARRSGWRLGTRLVRPGGRVFALTAADGLPEEPDREIYFEGRRALIEVVST